MKTFRHFLPAIIALAALFTATSLYAAAKASPTPFVPHHTVIDSISADSITIKTFSGSKTYKIDKFTSITFEGNTVKTTDLKPGMKVSVVAGADPTVASEITASKPPKDLPPAKGK